MACHWYDECNNPLTHSFTQEVNRSMNLEAAMAPNRLLVAIQHHYIFHAWLDVAGTVPKV